MVIKKLREQKQWSQEQLATLSGLSIRTIQRIESGNRASLESLKSLAAVFETNIETLQKEIIVIDKKTEEWKAQPWWFRLNMVGIQSRKSLIFIEILCVSLGVGFWIAGFFSKGFLVGASPLFFSAYIAAWTVRKGDRDKVW
ncbi:helix-turn-helix domain-containing protein [Kangiella koreensis]|uniref:Transcriptional regulator, XRE family n=1 Tax=Kangiella koreensis (strain DSM 16069 / JCM 12317 / KCTC 12182 / SW-125) TaxID=523791 RepID=C7RD34_KANKD|nr:helix-turn-helix domain-containing protein [Kangiella koreensis]ACV27176.1 transcriptional regulator, XRE family [Kangiella koreensis DSM 16069]